MGHNEYLFYTFALQGERLTIYLGFWSGPAPTGANARWMVCGQEKKVIIFMSHSYSPLVGYILTIQLHLPIYKSPSALPSYLSYILIHLVRPSVRLSFTYLLLLSIPGPFFFGTLFLLLFHSFSFFLYAASFSLTSFRFHLTAFT